MCEPLSIAAGVASVFAASLKLTHSLLSLQTEFQRVPDTITQLCNEFHLTSVGLGELEQMLRSNQQALTVASQSDKAKQHLLQCVDATTVAMARSFTLLDAELEKLRPSEGSGARSRTLRMKFMWMKEDLNTLMGQVRDQRSSLGFLMQVVQSSKIDEIHQKFQGSSPGLSALRRTATVAKGSRPSLVRSSNKANDESINTPDMRNIVNQDTQFPDLEEMKKAQPPPPAVKPQPKPAFKPAYRPEPAPQPKPRFTETLNTNTKPPNRTPSPQPPRPAKPAPVPLTSHRSWPADPYAPSRKAAVQEVYHELHYAVASDDVGRIPILMDSGQDPLGLPINPYGTLPNASKTSLSLAAYLGRQGIMQVFLDRGFGWAINESIGKDLPPLLAAAYAGQESMVHMLLGAKANPRFRGPGNNSAMFWAAARGHASIVDLLIGSGAGQDVHSPNDKGQTPLMVASQHGHHEAIRALLAAGADVHYQNSKLQSPVHLAAHGGHFEAVRVLVAHKAQLNGPTTNGKTPLIFAAISGYFDVVDLLADAGAFINLFDIDGRTALYHAASLGHSEAVEVLLDRYAYTEAATKQGDRALHIAVEKGHARAVGLLLEHGARLEATRLSDNQSALGIAVWHKHREILSPLILFRAEQNPDEFGLQEALYTAAEWGLVDAMDALLESGAAVDGADDDNQSLLSRAIRENKPEAVDLLLEKGAGVDLTDRYGATPMHRVARTSNTRLAEKLIQAGAQLSALDHNGYTPLRIAEELGNPEMVALLLKHQPPALPPAEMPTHLPMQSPVESPMELPVELPPELPSELPAEPPTELPQEVPSTLPDHGNSSNPLPKGWDFSLSELPMDRLALVELPADPPMEQPIELP